MKLSEALLSIANNKIRVQSLLLASHHSIIKKLSQISGIKSVCMLCILFLMTAYSYCNDKLIHGYVFDRNTHEPLPHAHIVLKNTGFGTITNREGYFRYNMPESLDYPVVISISYVGYTSRQIIINDSRSNIIFLEPKDAVLPELVVEADFVLDMLANAFKKTPKNYPDEGSRYKGFYRQTLYKDDVVVYMGEAFLDTYKSSYKRSGMDSQIEILKFRKFTGSPNYEDSLRFYAGVFNTYLADYVKQKAYFLNPRFFDMFEYSYEKKVSYRDEMHFKINFEHIETMAGGSLLINENDLAYASIYFEAADSIDSGTFLREFSTASVNYTKLDDKYYLNNYDIKIYYTNLLSDETFLFNAVYSVSEAVMSYASPIPYDRTTRYRDIFMDSPVDTSRTFWDDYNIIQDDTQIKHFTSKYELKPHEAKVKRSRNLTDLIKYFSLQIGTGYTRTSNYLYPNLLIAYENLENEIDREKYIYNSQSVHYWSFSLGYNFTRRSSINYYYSIDNLNNPHYSGHELSYLYRSRIKHWGNPMFLDIGLGFYIFRYEKLPQFEERSPEFPFFFRSEDIYHTGIEGSAYHIKAQLAYFPERFIALLLNAKLAYIGDYNCYYKHNEDRLPGYNLTYRSYNTHDTFFFKDKLKPTISVGIRFYPFGAF